MRESDIRPANLLAEYLRLSAADAGTFFADPARWRLRRCPGCAADVAGTPAFVRNGFDLVRCPVCASLYVARVPEDDALDAFYRDSPSQRYWAEVFFPAVAEARRGLIFRPRAERIHTLAAELGLRIDRLVDVGAGAGLFLDACRDRGLAADGLAAVEPNAAMARALADRGYRTFAGFAAGAASDPAWRGRADLVVSFEVLEHTTDPAAFVADLAALARPGGLVLVSGLCGTGFDLLVLGPHAHAVSPPHHLTFLSRAGVEALVGRLGLSLVEFLTPGRLDTDIVRQAVLADPSRVADPFLRHLLLDAADPVRAAFQDFLAAQGLSSHMWFLARTPGTDG